MTASDPVDNESSLLKCTDDPFAVNPGKLGFML
jgi:hypothetical protein